MCVGSPGLGKTLTAEVYAEVIERPLYSIHAGALGTNADDIEKNLRTILTRAKRWNCVLLLDEADVFVMQRGASLTQNAIVAEFLRTLEYFDGLMFMTSNRVVTSMRLSYQDALQSFTMMCRRNQMPKRSGRLWVRTLA